MLYYNTMSDKNRYVNTKFWQDGYIVNLLPDEKLLFLYFLTSPMTNISGIYECPIKIISVHTGFDRENLEVIISRFKGKIHYIDGWVYIRNFVKHQSLKSPSVKKGIEIELGNVPQKIKDKIQQIEKMYDEEGNATLFDIAKEETEEEKDKKKKDKKKDDDIEKSITNIVSFYQERINTRSSLTGKAKNKLKSRLKEFTEEEILGGILRFSEDDWRMLHNKTNGIEWFFRSETQVQKWIELEPEKKEVKKVVKI